MLNGEGYAVLPDYVCAQELTEERLINLYPHDKNPVNTIYLACAKTSLRNAKMVYVRNYLMDNFS